MAKKKGYKDGGGIEDLAKQGGLGILPMLIGLKRGGKVKLTGGAGGGLGRLQKIGKGKKTSRK